MEISISRDKSTLIKGFAILFMILHHCLIKEFYLEPPASLDGFLALRLQIGMKMCVGIFTFIIGYGFWYCRSYDLQYVLNHVYNLLKRYWLVVLLLSVPFSVKWGYIFDKQVFMYNLVGIKHQYNLGNWYVYFYVYALLVLPLFKMLLKNGSFTRFVSLIVLFGALATFFSEYRMLEACFRYSPLLLVGLYCAKTQFLTRLSNKITDKRVWLLLAFLSVLLRCAISGLKGFSTDIIVAPIFIISISALFHGHENTRAFHLFTELGKYSTYMWFIHGVFFSDATRYFFQTLPFWFNNVTYLFLIAVLISFVLSIIFKRVEAFLFN